VKKRPSKAARSVRDDSSALERLRRENRELKEWRRRLSLLLDYTKKISAKKELGSLLRLLVDVARNVTRADRCTIFLLDKKKNELWSRMASGDSPIRVPANRGIVGEAVTTGRVVNIPDAYSDPRFNRDVDRLTGYHTRNLLTAPMTNNKGEIIGAFQVLNKVNGSFLPADEQILLVFAEQAAASIENAQLNEEIRSAARDTIFRLAAAAEYKDMDTRNHLERMSRYSALIAESLGMPREYCQNLLLASPMHDIGKLGVPDSILQKPGRLTNEEWDEMRKHPLYGAKILSQSENELIQMSERVALNHHEKWDGSGYPQRLKGESIPLEGRIVALADVFDALTSRRCYKPAFTMEDTLRIIEEGRGAHFDPRVVEAFFKCLPRVRQVMDEFADTPATLPNETPKDTPPVAAG
jgi:HD-GYP domain-containing protein (c-di-GMP phosphodiesterase class II)